MITKKSVQLGKRTGLIRTEPWDIATLKGRREEGPTKEARKKESVIQEEDRKMWGP